MAIEKLKEYIDSMKKEGALGEGKKKVVMSSFGAGLLWGAVQTEL